MASIDQQADGGLTLSDWPDAERSKASRYLAQRLAETRADYKSVALAGFALGAAVAGLAWLAAGILIEHWWLAGGMPLWLRWAWLLVGLAGAVAAAIRWLVPLLRYRVNLVYAARSIEREFPELHNDLVTAVLVRSPAASDSRAIRIAASLDHRAARQLKSVPVDGVIDKQHLVRLAAVLAVLVIGGSLYTLLSPKNPFVSAARLIAPWSGWAAPSRVSIESIECFWGSVQDPGRAAGGLPIVGGRLLDERRRLELSGGQTRLVRGRQLLFAASIAHLGAAEVPVVEVTPLLDDGRVDRRAEAWQARLRWSAEADRYVARLPASGTGLDRSVRLQLAAGDARSKAVTVQVIDAPSLLVRQAEYRFPAYTDRPPEQRQWQGDLRGLEGTEVLLDVESNEPLDAAWIDFLDTQREDDLRLLVSREEPTRAQGRLSLRLSADRTAAEHPSYRLRFRPRGDDRTGDQQIIDEPLTHRIEVLPDLAPEVSIDHPVETPLRVPPRAPVRIKLQAVDPDYALTEVRVETRAEGGGGVRSRVLWRVDPDQPDGRAAGGLRASTRIVPAEEAAGAAVIEYRGVAIDNRHPEPNTAATPWRQLIVDELAPPPSDPEPQWPDRKPTDAGGDQSAAGESSQPSAAGGAESKPQPTDPRDEPRSDEATGKPSPQSEKPSPQSEKGDQPPGDSGMQDAGGVAGPGEGQGEGGDQAAGQQAGGQRQAEGAASDANESNGGADGGRQPAGEPAADSPLKSRGDTGRDSGGGDVKAADPGGEPNADAGKPSGPKGDADGAEAGSRQRPGAAEEADSSGAEQDRMQGRGDGASAADAAGDRQPAAAEGPTDDAAADAPPKPGLASDGIDDGEALERILDHRRRQNPTANDGREQGDRAADGESACRPEAGEPCGEAGCKTCQGGGAGGGTAGGSQAAGGQSAEEPGGGQPAGDQSPAAEPTDTADSAAGEDAAAGRSGSPDAGGGSPAGQPGEMPAAEGASGGKGANADPEADAAAADAGGNDDAAADMPDGKAAGEGGEPDKPGTNDAAARPEDRLGEPKDGGSSSAQPDSGGEPAAAGDPDAAAAGDASGTPAASTTGGGGQKGGDQPDDRDDPAETAEAKPLEFERQDLSGIRRAADLALDHLRDAVRSGDDEVLDELGWSPEQAQDFLDRWDLMRRQAETDDPGKRGEFDRTLRSLGLRPDGVRSSGQVPTERRGPQADGRRTKPPLDYRERFKAFLKGTGGRLESE